MARVRTPAQTLKRQLFAATRTARSYQPPAGGGTVITSTTAALVTSLPASPADSSEVYFLADAVNGVVWHLRYRAASSSAHKWEFVGGSDLSVGSAGEVSATVASGVWSDIGTAIALTIPLAGDYLIVSEASLLPASAACTFSMGLRFGTTDPTIDQDTTGGYSPVASSRASLAHRVLATSFVAGENCQQRYWQNGGSQTINRTFAYLGARPVRVG